MPYAFVRYLLKVDHQLETIIDYQIIVMINYGKLIINYLKKSFLSEGNHCASECFNTDAFVT